jgi:hypothetical protein
MGVNCRYKGQTRILCPGAQGWTRPSKPPKRPKNARQVYKVAVFGVTSEAIANFKELISESSADFDIQCRGGRLAGGIFDRKRVGGGFSG